MYALLQGVDMTHGFDEVRLVADDELLSRLERLVKADRALSLKLLVHLGEVEARKLYLERGYSSMYDYCSKALGMSEAETYLRLLAAKTGKRFPLVLERLAEGGLHLTAIKLLHPHLTAENHVAVLDRARGMSKRQLEVLVAELAPKPDVPERLRKLPESRATSQRSVSLQAHGSVPSEACHGTGHHAAADGGVAVHAAADGGSEMCAGAAIRDSDALHAGVTPAALAQAANAAAPFALQPSPAPASTSPLSPGRFKLELTLGQEAYDDLEQLRELLRHQNPSGEITRIVERALRELLERTLKRRFAQMGSSRSRGTRLQKADALEQVAERKAVAADALAPQPDCSAEEPVRGDAARDACPCQEQPVARTPEELAAAANVMHVVRTPAHSRYVPRRVLREVYARDAGQCSYVSADGRRCAAQGFLEVHHHRAFARGGPASVDNLRLACRAHNFWLAERELGQGFMRAKVESRVGSPTLGGK
jgi:hypothetical protein